MSTAALLKDATGAPVCVYHGTAEAVEAFDRGAIGRQCGRAVEGFYFTDEREVAAGYATGVDGRSGRVIEARLRMENPLVVDFEGGFWNGEVYDGAELVAIDGPHLDEVVREARAAGHDGVIAIDVVDLGSGAGGDDLTSTVYVVFEPSQIEIVGEQALEPDDEVPARKPAKGLGVT